MPHQCTNCSRAFADGSKEMLGGCPDCGGNKFQFLPKGAVPDEAGPATGSPAPDRVERSTAEATVTRTQSAAPPEPEDDIIEAPAEPVGSSAGDAEDHAQADARRAVVTEDELPPADAHYGAEGPETHPAEEPDRPDLAELRRELNEQFESIKILQPGEYELNLMELYDREEYIIALEEDGRYVIDVPDTWREAE